MKFITRAVMRKCSQIGLPTGFKTTALYLLITAVMPACLVAAPMTAWDNGYAMGSDIGSMTNCAGDDEATGTALKKLAAQTADEQIQNGDLGPAEREQWIKGFTEGYANGYKDPDC
jgi:hypothetical protein